MLKINFVNLSQYKSLKKPFKKLQARLNNFHSGANAGNINIKLLPAHEMKKLNKQYVGMHKSTDVLGFAYREKNDAQTISELGDVVINTEDIMQGGAVLAEKVISLSAHGLLHVLGFDHRTKAQSEKFNKHHTELVEGIK